MVGQALQRITATLSAVVIRKLLVSSQMGKAVTVIVIMNQSVFIPSFFVS